MAPYCATSYLSNTICSYYWNKYETTPHAWPLVQPVNWPGGERWSLGQRPVIISRVNWPANMPGGFIVSVTPLRLANVSWTSHLSRVVVVYNGLSPSVGASACVVDASLVVAGLQWLMITVTTLRNSNCDCEYTSNSRNIDRSVLTVKRTHCDRVPQSPWPSQWSSLALYSLWPLCQLSTCVQPASNRRRSDALCTTQPLKTSQILDESPPLT